MFGTAKFQLHLTTILSDIQQNIGGKPCCRLKYYVIRTSDIVVVMRESVYLCASVSVSLPG